MSNELKVFYVHDLLGAFKHYSFLVQQDGSILRVLAVYKDTTFQKEMTIVQPWTIFQGSFKDGLAHGKGTLYYPNKTLCYQGEFLHGKFHGVGEYTPPGYSPWKWKGSFRKGDLHGRCQHYDIRKERVDFEGEFENGQTVNHTLSVFTGKFIQVCLSPLDPNMEDGQQ